MTICDTLPEDKRKECKAFIRKETIDDVLVNTGGTAIVALPASFVSAAVVGIVAPQFAIPTLAIVQSGLMAIGARNALVSKTAKKVRDDRAKKFSGLF